VDVHRGHEKCPEVAYRDAPACGQRAGRRRTRPVGSAGRFGTVRPGGRAVDLDGEPRSCARGAHGDVPTVGPGIGCGRHRRRERGHRECREPTIR
jgi:hypothetical protein